MYRFFFKKKLAHAYYGRRIFLSLLAGKFDPFEQKLLTEINLKKSGAGVFFLSLLAGKFNTFEQRLFTESI